MYASANPSPLKKGGCSVLTLCFGNKTTVQKPKYKSKDEQHYPFCRILLQSCYLATGVNCCCFDDAIETLVQTKHLNHMWKHPIAKKHQDDGQPLLNVCRPNLLVCSAPLALVGPPSAAFRLTGHVQLVEEPVGERGHSDWMFSFANQCIRIKISDKKARKQWSQEAHTEGSSNFPSSSDLRCFHQICNITCSAFFSVCITKVLALFVSLSELWIQTIATCWYTQLFPLMQAQNINTSLQ